MKKFSMFAAMVLVIAFAAPVMAKVNLSGGMWVTYWAQEESHNVEIVTNSAPITAGQFLPSANQVASKNSFMLGGYATGNGLNAHVPGGYGFALVADCPVNDWVRAYVRTNVRDGGNVAIVYSFIDLKFMPELNLRAGLMQTPFNNEQDVTTRPGHDDIFISEYTQDAMGLLRSTRDVGVMAFGSVADGLLAYEVALLNGSVRTVADTAGVTGPDMAMDANDAKEGVLALKLRPVDGLYVGGAVAFGDYALIRNDGDPAANITSEGKGFTAYDVNAGYDLGGVFLLTGEYAMVKHDELLPKWNQSGLEVGLNREDGRESEYIIRGIYSGIDDVQLGLRYSVVDPKNVASEDAAGYNSETKLSFAASYDIARNTIVKAEYSIVKTERGYLDSYGAQQRDANTDPDDNILALQLGVQF